MNNLYHDFSVTFNSWFVIAPLFILLAGLIGTGRFCFDHEVMKIKRRGRKFTIFSKLSAMLMAIVVLVMIIRESFAGILQFFMNHLLIDESPVWALVLAIACLPVILIAYYYLMLVALKVGSYIKYGYLVEHRSELEDNYKLYKAINDSENIVSFKVTH